MQYRTAIDSVLLVFKKGPDNLFGIYRRHSLIAVITNVVGLPKASPTAGVDPKDPMSKVFAKFGLEQTTVDFVGHALALYANDE